MNDLKLIPIDPESSFTFKTQMLFYSAVYNVFRLGSVDYIREDAQGRTIVYTPFQEVELRTHRDGILSVAFNPTHYLNIELGELVKKL